MNALPLYLHLLGAATWLGGLIWLGVSTVIAARSLPREQFRPLVRRLGRGFVAVSVLAWILIASTGLGFAFQRGWPGLVIIKVVLASLVVAATAAHVVTGARPASRGAAVISRTLSGLILLGTLALFWIGVQLAG